MKTLLAVIALSFATVFSAQAQTTKSTDKTMDTKTMKEQPQQDMSAQIKTHTDRMTKDLNLTADQTKEVMAQNKTLYGDMSRMKDMKEADMPAMKKKSTDKYDAAMKRILKDDQYKKYSSMKDMYMKDMSSSDMSRDHMNDNMDNHMKKDNMDNHMEKDNMDK